MKKEKHRVLLVDDAEENLDALVAILTDEYEIQVAKSGKQALKLVETVPPDIILLDIIMPEMDGYEVCRKIKMSEKSGNVPVIFLTSFGEYENEGKAFAVGGDDFIRKPFHSMIVKMRIRHLLELQRYQNNLIDMVNQKTEELLKVQFIVFDSLSNLAEMRDPETGEHITRTKEYVRILAKYINKHSKRPGDHLSKRDINFLYHAAPLHDLGKVAICDQILLKPGPLTTMEMAAMKMHSVYGYYSIGKAMRDSGLNGSFLAIAADIAYCHHERWDGSGYPRALAGEAIPLPGRIMAIADVYDALINRRSYKEPFSHEKACEIILSERGKQFDPVLTDSFRELSDQFNQIAIQHSETDQSNSQRKILKAVKDINRFRVETLTAVSK